MSLTQPRTGYNPTRAQLRLVVLRQWVRAGLDLARGAKAAGGVLGGAVALWRIFQAVRLAIALIGRLSELRAALAVVALSGAGAAPDPALAGGWDDGSDDPAAACLRHALAEIAGTLREVLGLGRTRSTGSDAVGPASAPAERENPGALGRPRRRGGRPADRPPRSERRRARRRRPWAADLLQTLPPPFAEPADGRLRLSRA